MSYSFEDYLIKNKIMTPSKALNFALDMDQKCRNEGGYWVSMLDEKRFLPILQWLKGRYSNCFLDVGSGCGDKLILASKQFSQVRGIEICKSLYEFSLINLKRVGATSTGICNMDAFNYDYSNEEVIFMFSPLIDRSLLKKLYLKIIDDMPRDSILIECNPQFIPFKVKEVSTSSDPFGYYIKK